MADVQRLSRLFLIFATGFGSGMAPVAPGTAGTIVGVCLYWLFSHLAPSLLLITCITFIFLSVWIAERAAHILQQRDPGCIVIDEISGYLVTMLLIPWNWEHAVIGFLLFRLLDITKPFPIRRIDQNVSGGWGIVLDDVLAGVYANIILQAWIHWT